MVCEHLHVEILTIVILFYYSIRITTGEYICYSILFCLYIFICYSIFLKNGASLIAQSGKNLPAIQETWV